MKKTLEQIVILAGFSAAGKSTLGNELESLGYQFIRHQPLVHEIATNKGYQRARHWLADVGLHEFASESTNMMVKRLSEIEKQDKNKAVIDVAYGIEMLHKLTQNFADTNHIVVAVLAERELRIQRIQQRMGGASSDEAIRELNFRDKFLTDAGLNEVLTKSDLEVKNIGEPNKVARELVDRLRHIVDL